MQSTVLQFCYAVVTVTNAVIPKRNTGVTAYVTARRCTGVTYAVTLSAALQLRMLERYLLAGFLSGKTFDSHVHGIDFESCCRYNFFLLFFLYSCNLTLNFFFSFLILNSFFFSICFNQYITTVTLNYT